MSVRIRLARRGTKNRAFYRIVVADSRAPRSGRFIDQVGVYDPVAKPARIDFKSEKLQEWLRRGAQPTRTVAELMKRAGQVPDTDSAAGETMP